jgi:hypothetical protein
MLPIVVGSTLLGCSCSEHGFGVGVPPRGMLLVTLVRVHEETVQEDKERERERCLGYS